MTTYISPTAEQPTTLRTGSGPLFVGVTPKQQDYDRQEQAIWSTQARDLLSWSKSTHQKETEASTYRTVLNGLMRISQVYTPRERDDVVGFLQRHSSLLILLDAAIPHLQKAFGEQVGVTLEVDDDPETGHRQLAAMIQSPDSPEQALAQLHEFDHEWWLDQLSAAQGTLLFHVEYA